eukprot:6487309-Amphidinium_carterae.2
MPRCDVSFLLHVRCITLWRTLEQQTKVVTRIKYEVEVPSIANLPGTQGPRRMLQGIAECPAGSVLLVLFPIGVQDWLQHIPCQRSLITSACIPSEGSRSTVHTRGKSSKRQSVRDAHVYGSMLQCAGASVLCVLHGVTLWWSSDMFLLQVPLYRSLHAFFSHAIPPELLQAPCDSRKEADAHWMPQNCVNTSRKLHRDSIEQTERLRAREDALSVAAELASVCLTLGVRPPQIFHSAQGSSTTRKGCPCASEKQTAHIMCRQVLAPPSNA